MARRNSGFEIFAFKFGATQIKSVLASCHKQHGWSFRYYYTSWFSNLNISIFSRSRGNRGKGITNSSQPPKIVRSRSPKQGQEICERVRMTWLTHDVLYWRYMRSPEITNHTSVMTLDQSDINFAGRTWPKMAAPLPNDKRSLSLKIIWISSPKFTNR